MKTLLLIDDDADGRFALRQLLKPGFRILEAEKGEAGIRLALDERPDLVILDLRMPGIDGFEVCARLRSNPSTRRIPIIMVTGDFTRESRIKGLEIGADDYVCRPFDPAELVARLRARLRRVDLEENDRRPLELGNLKLDPLSCEASVSGRPLRLTQVELGLLRYFLERPNQVIERAIAIRDIWSGTRVTERTVDTHVAHLRRKLQGFSGSIETVYKIGYILKTEALTRAPERQEAL